MVDLLECFQHGEHVCLVFERLGPTLLEAVDVSRKPHERGASSYLCLHTVQQVARRLFEALDFLHGMGLSHTALKPENIMFTEWQQHKGALPRVCCAGAGSGRCAGALPRAWEA